ncbi:lysylphosphatidylglycerol synthase domain-containing protein [Manganibacter manganicus]|uniref:Uncharacterized protein n=1 Tax=Manganibacter manganicus TaxID=1873176 RepID=A0A1V8RRZ1_9HYPH|nr:lysylphosphatidylglycerol synthase domain-containing protein [Pseudaminobacter manganicus]OQM75925.1 hypothetical protein BFN67_03215 [Pseudaminobacter manganicus]
MNWTRYFWPLIGLAAVAFSIWLLIGELQGISLDDVWDGLTAISTWRWFLSAFCAVAAYAALAAYDHLALLHLNRRVSWLFVTLCSFTTYALSHNIGGSVFSGAVIRYRAYGTKGLSGHDVGILVGICWITFILATLLVSGIVLLIEPDLFDRFSDIGYTSVSAGAGALMLLVVVAYVFGSWLQLQPLKIGAFEIQYPRLPIVARQLLVGPIELLAAAAIIFFALPASGNPGYLVVLGVFLASFSAAQISHAPGGIGVFEVVFLTGLSNMDPAGVVAALLVFRLFYLIVPLLIALVIVLVFERSQFGRTDN